MLSIILPNALSGRETASVANSPVRWKNRLVSRAILPGNDVKSRAGSSPSAVFDQAALTVDALFGPCGPLAFLGSAGGISATARPTFSSNSSRVMLLRPDASIVSMNEIAPPCRISAMSTGEIVFQLKSTHQTRQVIPGLSLKARR